jgi:hypothetical protein
VPKRKKHPLLDKGMAEALRDAKTKIFFVTVDCMRRVPTTALMKGDCFQHLADEGQIQGSVLTVFPINRSS